MAPDRYRRRRGLLLELRESCDFDFQSLVAGGDGLSVDASVLALAPDAPPVAVTAAEMAVLAGTSALQWSDGPALRARWGEDVVRGLAAKGLLLDAEADEQASHWWPLAAVFHRASRWCDVAAPEGARSAGPRPLSELYRSLGPPPPHLVEWAPPAARRPLPHVADTAFDALLDRRATCRNFDAARALPLHVFAQLMRRVYGARGVALVPPGVTVIKRTSPSGGGLHPTEAYLLVQRVDGVAPGLYHYHPVDHALEPLRELSADAAAALALRMVAGQEYFADAHVLVAMASRFPRSLWKYRNHAKAYRAAVLDVGHLSQTLYLCATEQGLAAYVTAAINEADIEQAFDLEPLEQGPLAVCGFGWRAAAMHTVEFDPLRAVWPAQSS